MSMMNALNAAVTGLRANQIGVDTVSRNIANAGTDGYTRKIAPRENMVVGAQGMGVRVMPNERQVSFFLQERIRVELGRTGRLDVMADYMGRMDAMFGASDKEGSISYTINDLAITIGGLIDSPENAGVRAAVISKADMAARQMNQMSQTIQTMRSQAEQGMAMAVEEINAALNGIETLNREISNRQMANQTTADLEDRRDVHLQTVARNLDVRTIERTDGTLVVFASGGQTLVADRASQLSFDSRHQIGAEQLYSSDPAKRSVGTLILTTPGGTRTDLIESAPPREGRIAGLLEMRDRKLVEAQNQLDELAQSLALALSDRVTDLTDVDHQNTLDLSQPPSDGDRFTFSYVTAAGPRSVTAYFVQPHPAPGDLPLDEVLRSRVPDPDNAVFINLSPGDTPEDTLAKRVHDALVNDANLPLGMFVDPGAGPEGTTEIRLNDALLSRVRGMTYATTHADTGPQIALFRDGNPRVGVQTDYHLRLGQETNHRTGLAARIAVNDDLMRDSTLLLRYARDDGADSALGDPSRPSLMVDRLTETRMVFSRDTALGGQNSPYHGTILDLARAMTSFQGMQAVNTADQAADQQARTQLLEERFQGESGVNVDDEMAQLIMLQSAYAACAKVVRTVDSMMETLMSMR